MSRRYTLKQDGKYWTRLSIGQNPGFYAASTSNAYTYEDIATVRTLQRLAGGTIVAVVPNPASKYGSLEAELTEGEQQ